VNLAHLVRRAAELHPGRPAVSRGAEVVADYARAADRVARLAGGLRGELGLASGETVAIAMRNHPAYLEVLFAIWHAGLVAAPVNAKLHARELAFILGHSGARVCFAADELVDAVTAPTIIDVDSDAYSRLLAGGPFPLAAEVRADALAWLFYTSGTTGRPKGAMLTHRNLMAMTLAYFADIDAIDHCCSMIHAAPMSHGSGLYALPHVAAAANNVVPRSGGFDPDEVLELLEIHTGASLFFAPTMVHRLVRASPSRRAPGLRTIVYGGGPMYVEDLRAALDRFGPRFAQIYGQGEAPMTITSVARALHAPPHDWSRLATVGVARTGVEVAVVDASDEPCAPGTVGEVVCRGDVVMAGYRDDPEATAATLRRGWLHTGDLGALDEHGFLTLHGRKHDMIISGGSNIYPREVEEVLLTHPDVLEVAVVGRPHPDWGEEVVAFVVPRPGATIDLTVLDALCLDRIARFKRPRHYQIRDGLPKNAYGKVLKTALRDALEPAG
jgi:long-chain acyl-CoA synthetase